MTIKKIAISNQELDQIASVHKLGHFGGDSMAKILQFKGISFPSMKKKCIQFVKKCLICQKWSQSKPVFSPIQPVFNNNVWEHICIDLMGPMPANENEFHYILVCVDVFTRFIVCRPLFDKKAVSVAEELVKIFSLLGLPRIIQSDNGTEFANSVLNEITNILNIQQKFTTQYHPAQNGLVERNIQNVSNVLKKLTTEKYNEMAFWPNCLDLCQFYLNNKFSNATNFQAFTLMFGRTSKLFSEEKELVKEEEIIQKWMEIHEIIYPQAETNLKEKQRKMKNYVDSTRPTKINEEKGMEYEKEDVVIFKNLNKTSKWEEAFEGPGRIVSIKKRTGNYTICELDDREAIIANNIPAHWIRKLE